MGFENTAPEIGPGARKQIDEGIHLSETGTDIGSIRILKEQIKAHEEAISKRNKNPENDLKNMSDRAIIKELSKKIRNLQQGITETEETYEETDLEEPYLKK
jgi:hypothetical protein